MANGNSTRTNYDLSPWQNKDPLTLEEAACLWAGYPPGLLRATSVEPRRKAVKDEIFRQIQKAAEFGQIAYERPQVDKTTTVMPYDFVRTPLRDLEGYQKTERVPVSWGGALFTRVALRNYADSIGLRPAFLFPEVVEISALRCLDKSAPHFSGELEAAILAWQYASELAEKSKRKPKSLIAEWLKANRPQYPESGKAFERISTLANWDKTTGPKALTGR